jgi:hypothetical protein
MTRITFNAAATTLATAAAAAILLVLCLAGCGGSSSPDKPSGAGARRLGADEPAAAQTADAAEFVPPLIADDGSLMPALPRATPTDPGARTRAGRYATPAQADQLEAALGPRVLRVDAHDVARLGVDTVAGIVHGLQAAADLGRSDPVLVEGSDPRLSATLADRLADDGLTRVWVVVAR